ncbi:DNA cytosine methyltransferase [Novosphingobium sp. fls2-241-R2A-195]|uniref:DNA cytosine methyltransferase n=1 Tax=Novosphingobium sp. fls2-241-R2A-195 TaxID=3040296 RepID=UPI00254C858C|nr:DNA cytosine methyltransferase [Novosphingobium sp. fls2-241-R2A-195]
MTRVLSVVDLFSGSGGMSTGFHRDGRFEVVGAVDIERGKPSSGDGSTNCNETYKANIGIAPMAEDLSAVDPLKLLSAFDLKIGDLGVLISCAPCTGFSQKNANNLVNDDPRNRLVQRSAEFVRHFMPEYFVMENVKELIKGKHQHHFRSLVRSLTDLGYKIKAEVHDLTDFGLPQRRIRAMLVAKREGHAPFPEPSRSGVRTVRDAISHLPPLRAGETHPEDDMHACPSMTEVPLKRLMSIPQDGGSWTDIPDSLAHLRIPSMNKKKPGSFPDIYGRLWWDRPAPTITRECSSPGNGRYCHPEQDRLLSVREMSLLQGFPADYVFKGSLASRYRHIGDAVPPLVSEQIASVIGDDANGQFQAQTVMRDLLEAI